MSKFLDNYAKRFEGFKVNEDGSMEIIEHIIIPKEDVIRLGMGITMGKVTIDDDF